MSLQTQLHEVFLCRKYVSEMKTDVTALSAQTLCTLNYVSPVAVGNWVVLDPFLPALASINKCVFI